MTRFKIGPTFMRIW